MGMSAGGNLYYMLEVGMGELYIWRGRDEHLQEKTFHKFTRYPRSWDPC